MKITTLPMAALCLGASLHTVHAATERDLDSHVHGGAKLNIAFDGQKLFMELESPWMNLVGFEHEPSTDEQRTAVAEATQRLEKADGLFAFTGTECVLAESYVESSMSGESDHDVHEGEEHAEHEGEEHEEHAEHEGEEHEEHAEHEGEEHEEHAEHEGEEHEEHEEHAEHEAHEEGESHSAVVASYVFDCADSGQLETLSVGLFDVWSGIEDIDVQLVGPAGQSSVELAPGNASLETDAVM